MRKLLLCLACSGLMAQDPWTKLDIGLETAYQVLNVVDYRQTSNFHNFHEVQGNQLKMIQESNPFLGKHPYQANINRLFVAQALLHGGVSLALNSKPRTIWQTTSLMWTYHLVDHNASIGARIVW